jgi:RNA polymerase sigma-70 factor (ECF subfamily)
MDLPARVADLDERRLVRALREGDESAYAELHARYDDRLVALAKSQGCTHAVAQEVVQETWAAVVRSIHSFEGRSTLKTWIFRILVNAANAHARCEGRSIPVSALPENVIELHHTRRAAAMPADEQVVWKETVGRVRSAIESLSSSQRSVITLRDVHGWSSEDVRGHLGLSEGNHGCSSIVPALRYAGPSRITSIPMSVQRRCVANRRFCRSETAPNGPIVEPCQPTRGETT